MSRLGPMLVLLISSFASAQLKIATFNASLYRDQPNQLLSDLSTITDPQIKSIAEIIQRTNPDILLINEIDYAANNSVLDLFQSNYLSISQNGAPAINFTQRIAFPSNTGISSGFDLNNNGHAVTTVGASGYADDAFGFGAFPGQHAF